MKMNKSLRTFLLSGMATAFSLFHANGQDIKKSIVDNVAVNLKPTALMLISDMSHGVEDDYNRDWDPAHNKLAIMLQGQDFKVDRIGSGFGYLKLEDNPDIDSILTAMSQNKADDIIYINAHGASSDGIHKIGLGHEVISLAGNGVQLIERSANSVEVISHYVSKSNEKDHPVSLIFDSCAGNQLLLDIHKKKLELPEGVKILTISNPEDVVFSSTVANALSHLADRTNMKSLIEVHHAYNTHIFDDTNNGYKYMHSPSGSTYTVSKGHGEYSVMSPYKSFQERVGKGLSEEDKNTIFENFINFYDFTGDDYKLQREVFRQNIEDANEMIKNATSFEDLSRPEQRSIIGRLTQLKEEVSLPEYSSFMALNHMRLEARSFSRDQKEKMQKSAPSINSPR